MSGIIVKVWPIGNFKTSSSKQISDSLAYIENEEKTRIRADDVEEHVLSRNIISEVSYVVNDIKTMSGALVGCQNLRSVETAFKEMLEVKKKFGKEGGRLALHGTISLEEFESGPDNIRKLMLLCQEVLSEVFPDNQAVFAVHTNTENLHVHFLINSVGLDGKKIHQDKGFVRRVLQPAVNRAAERYGLTPNTEWGRNRAATKTVTEMDYGEKKALLKNLIDRAIEKAEDFEHFLSALKKTGVKVRLGKYLSLSMDGFKYTIRSGKLGDEYTVDSIARRIREKKADFLFEKATDEAEKVAFQKPELSIREMKKYREMDPAEKQRALRLIRIGRNPWREYYSSSWQLKRIAEDDVKEKNIDAIIRAYSIDGSVAAALSEMISRQKKLSEEKKAVKENLKRNRGIAEIYKQMKPLMKKAFLYEETRDPKYRADFEKYSVLVKRLKSYEKTPEEAAAFIEDQNGEIDYISVQSKEISAQYKAVRDYAVERELIDGEKHQSLYDLIGVREAREMALRGVLVSDMKFLCSKKSSVYLMVNTTPSVKDGKAVSEAVVTAMFEGKAIESLSSKDKDFAEKLYSLSKRYGLYNAATAPDENEARKTAEKAREESTIKATSRQR